MKSIILGSEQITKDSILEQFKLPDLSKDEIDEYLDIITAINNGQLVYNISTNNGDYLIFIDKYDIELDNSDEYDENT